jgi:hypothetical protein
MTSMMVPPSPLDSASLATSTSETIEVPPRLSKWTSIKTYLSTNTKDDEAGLYLNHLLNQMCPICDIVRLSELLLLLRNVGSSLNVDKVVIGKFNILMQVQFNDGLAWSLIIRFPTAKTAAELLGVKKVVHSDKVNGLEYITGVIGETLGAPFLLKEFEAQDMEAKVLDGFVWCVGDLLSRSVTKRLVKWNMKAQTELEKSAKRDRQENEGKGSVPYDPRHCSMM